MSRRAAETLIADGRVKINGHTAAVGEKADPVTDTILVDGKPLPESGDKVYIMLNKPRGYVTTMSDEKGRRDVTESLSENAYLPRLPPSGDSICIPRGCCS